MPTQVTADVQRAAAALLAGELVAFPTETVWGLGAVVDDELALARIFETKGRPDDNPLIVHVATVADACSLLDGSDAGLLASRVLRRFAPGPVTVVVPRPSSISPRVSAGLDTVALRVPSHPVAAALLAAVGRPVAAPSANLSGRPSPTTAAGVLASLDGRVPWILDGARSVVGLESTVIDCVPGEPMILRAGAVGLEELRTISTAADVATHEESLARSPGTRHRHYAPRCRVLIHDPATPNDEDTRLVLAHAGSAAYLGIGPAPRQIEWALIERCGDVHAYAHALFEVMRRCDEEALTLLVCERPPDSGIGVALLDRLRRASQPSD